MPEQTTPNKHASLCLHRFHLLRLPMLCRIFHRCDVFADLCEKVLHVRSLLCFSIPVTGSNFKYLTTFQTGRLRNGRWMSQRLRPALRSIEFRVVFRREMYRRNAVPNNGACHFSVILFRGTTYGARLERDIARLISRGREESSHVESR